MTDRLYRSLYSRIALGFILCVGGVLTIQAAIVLALLSRTEIANEGLTQAASSSLARAVATEPQRDLQEYLRERYPHPPQSLLAVFTSGQVLSTGRRAAPERVIKTALKELQSQPVRAIPQE